MDRVQADPVLKEALARNGKGVEIHDETGQVIGYAVSAEEMEKVREIQEIRADMYARADSYFDPETLKASLADTRSYPNEEILKLVEGA
jgi:hypothetical protein